MQGGAEALGKSSMFSSMSWRNPLPEEKQRTVVGEYSQPSKDKRGLDAQHLDLKYYSGDRFFSSPPHAKSGCQLLIIERCGVRWDKSVSDKCVKLVLPFLCP